MARQTIVSTQQAERITDRALRHIRPIFGKCYGYPDTEDAALQLKAFLPETQADAIRKNVALDIVGDLRRIRFQIEDITTRIKTELAASGTKLLKIPGVGIVTAARILGRTGDPTRFVNEAAFASYSGTAPIEVASADKQRHRLSRSGDRTLNSAIHIVAVTQARTPSSDGYAYHQRKMAEGKTSREAMRCLKRQVAKRLWRTMLHDLHERLEVPLTA